MFGMIEKIVWSPVTSKVVVEPKARLVDLEICATYAWRWRQHAGDADRTTGNASQG